MQGFIQDFVLEVRRKCVGDMVEADTCKLYLYCYGWVSYIT